MSFQDGVDAIERGLATGAVEMDALASALVSGQHEAATARNAIPFFDNLFWFGDGVVNAGDWLFLYTGPGEPTTNWADNRVNKIYTLHWGKQHTMFANSTVVPILFRVDAVDILLPPGDQPQLPRLCGS